MANPDSPEAEALKEGILLDLIIGAMTSGRGGLVKVKGQNGKLTVGVVEEAGFAQKAPNTGTVATVAGRPIQFDGQFYSADGFKFSSSYYDRLWSSGGASCAIFAGKGDYG